MTTKTMPQVRAATPAEATAPAAGTLSRPAYYLIVVLGLLAWTLGFLDLLNHTTPGRPMLGLYSVPFFALLVVYASGFLVWGFLLTRPGGAAGLGRRIAFIQDRWWAAGPVMVVSALAVWQLATAVPLGGDPGDRLRQFPFLRLAIIWLIGLANGTLVLAGWNRDRHWRRTGLVGLAATVVGVELLLQGLAFFGLAPGRHQLYHFTAYSRVYANQEGLANGRTNNYGWYYPDFRLEPDSRRILLIGDTYLQALQIEAGQHVGVQLETLLQEVAPANTEVLALGHPGFGPGLYLSFTRLEAAIDQFQPDEIILFFEVGSDFQTDFEPAPDNPVYTIDADGVVEVHPDSVNDLHYLKHLILDGYKPVVDPVEVVKNSYLTPVVAAALFGPPAAAQRGPGDALDILSYRGVILDSEQVSPDYIAIKRTRFIETPGASNFLFEKEPGQAAEQAFTIAEAWLRDSYDLARLRGVAFRVVTIPAFPRAFYTRSGGGPWSSDIGPYDLLGPERRLQIYAQHRQIPFLAMGQYLGDNEMTAADIERLYYKQGQGHLTPAGHAYLAEAIYACFYATGEETPGRCGW